MERIEFTESKVKEYLDGRIRYWRNQRDNNTPYTQIAPCYIDAFQSVRTSLFGELLAKEK